MFGKHRPAGRTFVCAVTAVGLCLCASAGTAFAREKPVIFGFGADPGSVASGGTVSVSDFFVEDAYECTVSSSKPVAGLPSTFVCGGGPEEGPFQLDLVMPTDFGKKAVKYTLALTARGFGGKAKAKATVSVRPALTASAVTAGLGHTCAVLSTGHVECWGDNAFGQLGDGTFSGPERCAAFSAEYSCSRTPVEAERITDATKAAAGGFYACAVLSTGHVDCWGINDAGELGDGTTTGSDTPVEVSGITDARQVSAGGDHTCAALSTGRVECWGGNGEGQLGDGTTTSSDTPVEVQDITDATQVSAGGDHTCAALSTGRVECWGENSTGELGDGTTTRSDTPVGVTGITDATQVGASGYETCAALSTGRVECWGDNVDGELGDGTTTGSDTPVVVTGITNATQVATGYYHTCAVLSTGDVECWGENRDGDLGDGTTGGTSDTPVEAAGVTDATEVTSSAGYSCALLSSRHIECWGENPIGNLGNGTTEGSDTPIEVVGI
jgi:alpha-tubulin suppressor-like RCC1 family protein